MSYTDEKREKFAERMEFLNDCAKDNKAEEYERLS